MANFDIMTDDGRKLFLGYDQEKMIRQYHLKHDEKHLYFWFFSNLYRIEKETGYVEERPALMKREQYRERGAEAFAREDEKWVRAGNELAMTFYDILCYGKDNAAATGEYINLNSLVTMISAAGNPGKGMFQKYEKEFDEQSGVLEKVLIRLGGWKEGKADISYELPLFDFMNVRFQLWHKDEDFPPSIAVFVDTGILQFMHYETVWYMMHGFMFRLEKEMKTAQQN